MSLADLLSSPSYIGQLNMTYGSTVDTVFMYNGTTASPISGYFSIYRYRLPGAKLVHFYCDPPGNIIVPGSGPSLPGSVYWPNLNNGPASLVPASNINNYSNIGTGSAQTTASGISLVLNSLGCQIAPTAASSGPQQVGWVTGPGTNRVTSPLYGTYLAAK